jgi:hypothetical protein
MRAWCTQNGKQCSDVVMKHYVQCTSVTGWRVASLWSVKLTKSQPEPWLTSVVQTLVMQMFVYFKQKLITALWTAICLRWKKYRQLFIEKNWQAGWFMVVKNSSCVHTAHRLSLCGQCVRSHTLAMKLRDAGSDPGSQCDDALLHCLTWRVSVTTCW